MNFSRTLFHFKPKVKILSFGYGIDLGLLYDSGMYTLKHSYFTLKILPPTKTEKLIQTKLSTLPFPRNDFGLSYWLHLDDNILEKEDGYGLKRTKVAQLPLVVITPIKHTSKLSIHRNRLRKRIRKCVTSVIEQSMVTTRGGADDLILRDWTYVFFPTMALLNKDLHSNDLDRAMIDILQQARQKGLEKSVGLYNHSDDNDAT